VNFNVSCNISFVKITLLAEHEYRSKQTCVFNGYDGPQQRGAERLTCAQLRHVRDGMAVKARARMAKCELLHTRRTKVVTVILVS
jgi:hypothetical protein